MQGPALCNAPSSTGLQNGTTVVTIQRSYNDWRPRQSQHRHQGHLIVRFAVAKVMTRPSLRVTVPWRLR
jgi:hypothetical protein